MRANEDHFVLPSRIMILHMARKAAALLSCAVLAFMLAVTQAPAAPADQAPEEKPRSIVAVFALDGPVTESPVDDVLQLFGPPGASLKDLVTRLVKAASDPEVKAVVVLPETEWIGSAQIEELREALARVRKQGKEVYVHADSLMLGQYLLACGASRISVVPTGMLLVPGLQASSLHVRGLLDKLGVKPDFITEGAYKSAAELFTRDQPSPEADEMMNWLMDSWYASFKEQIAQSRKADAATVQQWLDNALYTAEQAKAAGLIDAVEHRPDFEALLKKRYGEDVRFERKYGIKGQAELDLSSPLAFLKIWTQLFGAQVKKAAAKPAVGIVYVEGLILPGSGSADPFGGNMGAYSSDVRGALEKAGTDDSIKAVVLRVNSPGGSATASEIILDATRRLKAKKPFVVSMGDEAGSGGYYVACAADTVFADATTLTGSIGVLGGKLATTEMWRKIGVTFKEYKRGQNAGIFSTDDVFTDGERARVRATMDEEYAQFKKHVTDIRGQRLKKPIDELAGGRVYTGKQALDLGLVDRLGTLHDAVAFAADQAKLKSYDVRVVPEPKNLLERLTERASGGKEEPGHVSTAAKANSLLKLAAPYLQNLDPRRTAAIASALARLDILQKESLLLTMPGFLLQD